jgi:hypothetical protein
MLSSPGFSRAVPASRPRVVQPQKSAPPTVGKLFHFRQRRREMIGDDIWHHAPRVFCRVLEAGLRRTERRRPTAANGHSRFPMVLATPVHWLAWRKGLKPDSRGCSCSPCRFGARSDRTRRGSRCRLVRQRWRSSPMAAPPASVRPKRRAPRFDRNGAG